MMEEGGIKRALETNANTATPNKRIKEFNEIVKVKKIDEDDDDDDDTSEDTTLKYSDPPKDDIENLSCINNGGKNYDAGVVTEQHFSYLKLIGKGFCGSVYMVQKIGGSDNRKIYAMKVMDKRKLRTKSLITHVVREREILAKIGDLPYVVTLHYAFQSAERLFLVFDYACGGDLGYASRHHNSLNLTIVKKVIAQLVIGINSLHENYIMHRDIKPDNILIDKHGDVVIVDLGFAKTFKGSSTQYLKSTIHTLCGTPCYMAPEIAFGQPYNYMIDIWGIGLITYELLLRKPLINNRKQICEKFLVKEMLKLQYVLPDHHAIDFIRRLCDWDPNNRMSHIEIRNHPFLKDIDWFQLTHQQDNRKNYNSLASKINTSSKFDLKNCLLKPFKVPSWTKNLFKGYEYIYPKHIRTNYKVADQLTIKALNFRSMKLINKKNFTLGKELYNGSYAKIYMIKKSPNRLRDNNCVVKKIRKEHFRHAEISALAFLKSEFICTLIGFSEDNFNYYIKIENLEGGTLKDFIGMGKSETDIYPICQQICSAIIFMHNNHFIHGDINPSNILFEDRYHQLIKIVDFGYSSYCKGIDFWHDVPRYTLDYAPPESLESPHISLYSKQTDIWSFGATLYYMYMGHPPFRKSIDSTESDNTIRKRILSGSHTTKSSRLHKATAPFKDFFKSCMKKDVRSRLRTYQLLNHRWFYSIPFYKGDT